jgi:hypothetical protein
MQAIMLVKEDDGVQSEEGSGISTTAFLCGRLSGAVRPLLYYADLPIGMLIKGELPLATGLETRPHRIHFNAAAQLCLTSDCTQDDVENA